MEKMSTGLSNLVLDMLSVLLVLLIAVVVCLIIVAGGCHGGDEYDEIVWIGGWVRMYC